MWPFGSSSSSGSDNNNSRPEQITTHSDLFKGEDPEPEPSLTPQTARAKVWDLLQQPPQARIGHHPVPPGTMILLGGVGVAGGISFIGVVLWQVRRIRAKQATNMLEQMASKQTIAQGTAHAAPAAGGIPALRKGGVSHVSDISSFSSVSGTPGMARDTGTSALGVTSNKSLPPVDTPAPRGTVSALTRPRGPVLPNASSETKQADLANSGAGAKANFAMSLRSPLGGDDDSGEAAKVTPDAVMMAFQAFVASVVIVSASSVLAWQILRRILGLKNLSEFIDYLQDHGPYGQEFQRRWKQSHSQSQSTHQTQGHDLPGSLTEHRADNATPGQPLEPSSGSEHEFGRPRSMMGEWIAGKIHALGVVIAQTARPLIEAVPLPKVPEGEQVPEHDQEAQDAAEWFDRLSKAMELEVQAELRTRLAARQAAQAS